MRQNPETLEKVHFNGTGGGSEVCHGRTASKKSFDQLLKEEGKDSLHAKHPMNKKLANRKLGS